MGKGTAKRRVVVRRKKVYVPPKLPDVPPVLDYCKSYGLTKRGWQIIARFHITCYYGRWWAKKSKKWWVIDMETANAATGTEAQGYTSKAKARQVAEKYRDKYGAWARIPF